MKEIIQIKGRPKKKNMRDIDRNRWISRGKDGERILGVNRKYQNAPETTRQAKQFGGFIRINKTSNAFPIQNGASKKKMIRADKKPYQAPEIIHQLTEYSVKVERIRRENAILRLSNLLKPSRENLKLRGTNIALSEKLILFILPLVHLPAWLPFDVLGKHW